MKYHYKLYVLFKVEPFRNSSAASSYCDLSTGWESITDPVHIPQPLQSVSSATLSSTYPNSFQNYSSLLECETEMVDASSIQASSSCANVNESSYPPFQMYASSIAPVQDYRIISHHGTAAKKRGYSTLNKHIPYPIYNAEPDRDYKSVIGNVPGF